MDGWMEEVWYPQSAVFTLEAYCCCWQRRARILSSPDSFLSPHIASYVEKPSDSFPPTRPRSQSPTSLRGRAKTQQLIKLDREVG